MAVFRRARRNADDGAILVIVLIVVTIIGLVVAAVISQTQVSIRGTTAVRSHLAKVYAADAGIEYAIQSLKRSNAICPEVTSSPQSLPTQTINGRTVEVACRTISGSASGGLGYAAIVLDANNSLTTQSGGMPTIEGPIYAVRLPSSIKLNVKGDVTEQQGRCTSDANVPTSLTIEPGYAFHCVPAAAPPDPPHVLPTSVPALASPVGDAITKPGCTIFKPGTYLTAPVLGDNNYFASGVYYFENIGTLTIDDQIFGGKQNEGAGETKISTSSPCATDGVDNGTGVKLILGGDSRLVVTSSASSGMELFARSASDPIAAAEGTQGISIQTVQAGAPGDWMASTLVANDAVLTASSGSNPKLVVHGMVYTPNALIDYFATTSTIAQLRGGVVAARLLLQSSAAADGLAVSVNVGTGRRNIVITSRAKGVTAHGERDVVATAVLDITSNAARTVSIQSWNTT